MDIKQLKPLNCYCDIKGSMTEERFFYHKSPFSDLYIIVDAKSHMNLIGLESEFNCKKIVALLNEMHNRNRFYEKWRDIMFDFWMSGHEVCMPTFKLESLGSDSE